MKYIVLAVIGLLTITGAHAADIGAPSVKDVTITSTVSDSITSGLYFGGTVGYGIATQDVELTKHDGEAELSSLSGEDVSFGVIGGYEHCVGRICGGVIGLYDWLETDTTLSARGAEWNAGVSNIYTIGGTVGVTVGSAEVFGLIGYTGGDWDMRGPGVIGPEKSRVRTEGDLDGIAYGGGIKLKLGAGLEAFGLYTFHDFDEHTIVNDECGRLRVDPDTHIVRAGLVYKLDTARALSAFDR